MFHSFVQKVSNYLKNHPRYTLLHVLGLLLGCVYLFQLNSYVLQETSFEVLGKEVGFIHVKNQEDRNTYRELSTLAKKLEGESEVLMDAIEKQLLPVLSGNSEPEKSSKANCKSKEI